MSNHPASEQPQQNALTNLQVGRDINIEGDIKQEVIQNFYGDVPHQTLISFEWMWKNFEVSKANAGARYTPEIHVELPEAWAFEGLGRTDHFFDRIQSLYVQLNRRGNKVKPRNVLHQKFPTIAQELEAFYQQVTRLVTALKQIDKNSFSEIDFHGITNLAKQIQTEEHNLHIIVRDAESALKTNTRKVEEIYQAEHSSLTDREIIGNARHNLSQLLEIIWKIEEFATSNSAKASNKKALLIIGEAGMGKTHLFCDIAKRRLEEGWPTIILLGQHFNQSEPWTQILQQLQLPLRGRNEFLSALDAAAQTTGKRALILIDALNEGNGKHLWRNELSGMLRVLKDYPRIALGVSCRTSYEQMVIPEGLIPESMIQVNHQGFSDHEYIATTTFFNYYGIERPSIPLLVPEFSNPLFLKIFCQGLAKQDLTRIPKGLKGITAIFNFFIDAIHKTLWRRLDYDPSINLVQKAVNLIAQHMAETGQPWIERVNASFMIDSLLPGRSYQQSLFSNLLSEGLLSEDIAYQSVEDMDSGVQQIDIIKFPYERFSDHLIVRYLLNTQLDTSNPRTSFIPTQPLGNLMADESQTWINSGWIEALSVQIPERMELELVEFVPLSKPWDIIQRAFLQSLIWRNPAKISKATEDYLNEIYTGGERVEEVYDLMLTIAVEPDHPFNAKFLHQHLMRLEMPERDQVWSTYLAQNYNQKGSIDRLLEWAWDAEKSHISDVAIELCSMALAWFLSTSHRYVRDRATKALISILNPRPSILIKVLEKFIEINDPYVLERLCAVAYGVAMMSSDAQAIEALASKVYLWIFAGGQPPVHILIRDYALGVIEVAKYRSILSADVDIRKARPPYQAEWLTDIPSEEDLKKYANFDGNVDEIGGSLTAIYSSVMGFGDFARYIIGTNYGFFSWSACRLDEKGKSEILATRKEKTESFLNSLTERQKKAWERYETIQSNIQWLKRLDDKQQIENIGQAFSEDEWDELSGYEETRFLKTIGKKKLECFKEYVLPHRLDPQGQQFEFDLSLAQRWIVQRVLELGWTERKFDWFDSYVNRYSYGRHANKAERIGKKYQWIGYHEFLAYVADNFEFIGDGFNATETQYNGSWQISVRDIDPSLLLRREPNEDHFNNSVTWWQPIQYSFSEADKEEKVSWITDKDDCPDPAQLLEVTHPTDNSVWLTLEGHYHWTEPKPVVEQEWPQEPERRMWFQIRSYIAHKSDSEHLLEWLQEQNFMGRWMPESGTMYEVHIGEFPWAPACEQYINHEDVWGNRGDRLPAQLITTTTGYTKESSTYDCSIDETISALLPSAWLIQNMELRWSTGNFRYVDSSNEVVAFDPSVEERGPDVLLISKEKLARFLDENRLVLIWTVLAERLLTRSSEWAGSIELSGAYSFQEDTIVGDPLKAWHRQSSGEKTLLN